MKVVRVFSLIFVFRRIRLPAGGVWKIDWCVSVASAEPNLRQNNSNANKFRHMHSLFGDRRPSPTKRKYKFGRKVDGERELYK